MYRPSLKSPWSLIALLALSIGLFIIAQNSYVVIKSPNYEEKLAAVNLAQAFIDSLKAEIELRGIDIDPIDDPHQTGLIGHRLTSITTDRGILSEKQASINPNLAAMFVEELIKQRLKPGDKVAVGITGSNPAVNLALYAAMSVLELDPQIIVSLSSASYGANREELTWLDMEAILKEKQLLPFGSRYASMGGSEDLGLGLSDNGIQSLRDAMRRNNVPMLMGANLDENVDLRMAAYQELLGDEGRYRLFINIGGGLANVGSEPNARLIPEGINHKLAEKEFEKEGAMMKMARKNVPVLHVRRILRWARNYGITLEVDKVPVPGEGKIFSSTLHNLTVASICLAILLAAIIAVIIFDRHDRRFMANIVDPDDEL